ncbi:hypothetical protein DI392_05865 [Vibrio albus]|uniref:Uncharacterized protein n=2 Tax=Vibrio albus TaxID=2200953 RepID=A0A2U3BCU9_9VIBR|nr:hypothetical protein DI392_05865 [Vibrio albus]
MQLTVVCLITWSVLVSPVPLVCALYLFGSFASASDNLIGQEYTGLLRIRPGNKMVIADSQNEKKELDIRRVITVFCPLMIRIETSDRRLFRIWRDSCNEEDYRHLLVVLKSQDCG